MIRHGLFLLWLMLLALPSLLCAQADKSTQPPRGKHIIEMTLKTGKVYIGLRPDLAPNHVKRIKTLISQKFYDNIVFHRVIDGFMAQTGDPTGTGSGGSDLPDLKAEFTATPHLRGAVSMARAQNVNSANSQFFICLQDAPHLNNQYTYFGSVIQGMEHIDNIKKGSTSQNGAVTNPDKMISLRLTDPPEKI